MTATYGRSPQEIAEDMVLEMARPMFNVSRGEAERFQIVRREVAKPFREQAETLLDAWEGSKENIVAAMQLWPYWCHATREYRHKWAAER
ncbi:hypothetical protein FXN65_10655 [Metapseudomonas lalkuanensis]|uniref:Uncharacterized protein n=1 Tax=Metapseudomonas lalkuanensis TaxID=2604832 RepID=A0A5J6QJD5_9GAMM|nr:hypothetical protein [Pseudomonas lalkuanensis]QEY62513.1 hypothetical protein FXN65_10655 [Pseudomonas lalkuanensis]